MTRARQNADGWQGGTGSVHLSVEGGGFWAVMPGRNCEVSVIGGWAARSAAPASTQPAADECVARLKMEAAPGFEPGMRVLQTRALPLGDAAPSFPTVRILGSGGAQVNFLWNPLSRFRGERQHHPGRGWRSGPDGQRVSRGHQVPQGVTPRPLQPHADWNRQLL